MLFTTGSFTALVALSPFVLSAIAGPLEYRQEDSSPSTTDTAITEGPTVALVQTVINGTTTTVEVEIPTPTESDSESASATVTGDRSETAEPELTASPTPRPTNAPLVSTDESIRCTDPNAKPFCQPTNNTEVYVGKIYYVTWNPAFFNDNSTVAIALNFDNSSQTQAWQSREVPHSDGFATVKMEGKWLNGYTRFNLTFLAVQFEDGRDEVATWFTGPTVELRHEPPSHYPPPPENHIDPNDMGLKVGLPIGLGGLFLVMFGLLFGMRKTRTIGLGNIMSRNRGYASGKSRRQRLGMGKKGAIRLQEREVSREHQYRDDLPSPPRGEFGQPQGGYARDEDLGSLVGTPTEEGRNAFRAEIERQRTGR
ncbi:hypothetical protein M501DRAFT_1010654 [Patellaria atrata CBS 101060]|uniref:Uncharacterized protein n=1 Tax=Patellaria atrata CBS 101060 TaxID=1346257 RepID=A0A9P4SD30_9PEZI|nr:hypothetical protein M501DRAFT_1010654 [Patellaria atrata CBS 101060]